MAVVKPFKGIRPPKALVEKVQSRPYDVLNSDEARAEAEGNEMSLYHIIKPEIDFPVGTDDAHYPRAVGGSWIMVGAKALRYDSVIQALEKGDFYMSCGPEIHDFYIEDGKAYVKCSEVVEIQFIHKRAPYKVTRAAEGETITEGSIGVWTGSTDYIRAVVTDAKGRRAWTNPIFFKDPQ